MQNSVIKGFLSFFVSFGRFLLLALICAALGFVVVWPLWYFAVKFPNVYSFVVLIGLTLNLFCMFFHPSQLLTYLGFTTLSGFFAKSSLVESVFFSCLLRLFARPALPKGPILPFRTAQAGSASSISSSFLLRRCVEHNRRRREKMFKVRHDMCKNRHFIRQNRRDNLLQRLFLQ